MEYQKITKFSKNSQQNNSGSVTIENDKTKYLKKNIYLQKNNKKSLIICIGLIGFMLKGKSLLDYTNLFFLNDYEKNDSTILKYFQ